MKIVGENRLSLSVTELVRFSAAGGDIDLRFGGDGRRAQQLGAAIHRRLQRTAGALYVPEVPLSVSASCGGITFELSGRADGVIEPTTDGGTVTIDEIKTTRVPPERLNPALHEMYFAQGAVYAHIYCVGQSLPGARVQLTYFNTQTDQIYRAVREYSAQELRERFLSLLDRLLPAARAALGRELTLRGQLSDAPFPFAEKREGQRDMVIEAYRAFRGGRRLFVCAPTGIGKTVSALYPALKAVGTGDADKIFYLCAKSVTAAQAAEAAAQIDAPELRTIILSARERMCTNKKKPSSGCAGEVCNPRACPAAAGHYERARAALADLLAQGGVYTPARVREAASAHRVCPYELSLDLSEFCTVVVCDYNYVFSPRVKLRRYFDEDGNERSDPTERFLLLVDEAHNLVARAREMYSAELSSDGVAPLASLGGSAGEAAAALAAAIRGAGGEVRETEEISLPDGSFTHRGATVVHTPPEAVTEAAEAFCRAALARLAMGGGDEAARPLLDAYYTVSAYLRAARGADERFVTFLTLLGDEVECRLLCVDPSGMLSKCLMLAHGALFFSATLTPLEYYINVLSGPGSAEGLSLESPFPPENLAVIAADRFSTRFGDREKSAAALADMIAGAVGARKGNYIAYFPSYRYMNAVHEKFRRRYPNVETVLQESGAGEHRRAEFLAAFRDDGARRVFFCVLGGIYSEGIDLAGERLIGVLIVGVGLPQLSEEGNVLAEYFETRYEAGFDYAYTYPGMNRVLQAAGRVIRGEDDRGIVVLIDDRYADGKYRALFPPHWRGIRCVGDAPSLREAVRRFWQEEEIT